MLFIKLLFLSLVYLSFIMRVEASQPRTYKGRENIFSPLQSGVKGTVLMLMKFELFQCRIDSKNMPIKK